MIELKPCPFCGGKASATKTANGIIGGTDTFTAQYKIGCSKCKMFFGGESIGGFVDGKAVTIKDGYAQAAEAWNRRVTDGIN